MSVPPGSILTTGSSGLLKGGPALEDKLELQVSWEGQTLCLPVPAHSVCSEKHPNTAGPATLPSWCCPLPSATEAQLCLQEDVCCWPWAPPLTEAQGQARPGVQAGGTLTGGGWAHWPAASSSLPQRPPESPFRAGPLGESGARDQALPPGPETTAPWRQRWGSAGGVGLGVRPQSREGRRPHRELARALDPLRGCVLRVHPSP